MNKTLTALYDSFYTPPQAADTREEIKTIHKQLILKLDKPERRLVLRLIDAKDRLAEETSMDSFVCGFRLAWRLANELNSYPESGRPAQSGQTERDARCSPQERWELPDEGLTPPRPWPPLVGRCVAAVAPCSKREGLSRECHSPSSHFWQKSRQHPTPADTEVAAPPDDLLWDLAAMPFTVTLLQEIHIMDTIAEQIQRRRMHGLYLSRKCEDITQLSRDLMGLHCWFHRNVAFSAVIRGADLMNWKHALTKTWLYRGTLHGVAYDDLPLLLAPHAGDQSFEQWMLRDILSETQLREAVDRVISLMEDGVYSRAEMRKIFADDYDPKVIDYLFSSWGGIFVSLACQGKVAFRNMTSRDFDLIDAQPLQMNDQVLLELLRRFFTAYGPATIADAMWFLGLDKKVVQGLPELETFSRLEYQRNVYYYVDDGAEIGDIPELTLLSGFDPLIVSYKERETVLPTEYKRAVILKSGICLPTIAVNGQVALKSGKPTVEFFAAQPERLQKAAAELVEEMQWRVAGKI